jgi:heat shock protein HslJ
VIAMSTIVLVLPVSQVTVSEGRAVTTATVTNQGTAPETVVVGVFPPLAATGAASASAVGWTTVERPQRAIQPGATEQFTVTFVPPDGAAAGTYVARFIAYSATGAPEESADQARQVDVVLAAPVPVVPVKRSSWWIYAVAAALVLVVGVVAFFVLRPTPDPCADGSCTPTPTAPTPTPPVVVENITWTLKSIRQSDMVIPISAKITLRVEGDKVSGFAGCNSYAGTWKRDGDNVQITNVLSSLVLCFPQQVAKQSSTFKSILPLVTTLESDGSTTLSLRTSDDQELRFIQP